MSLSNLPDVSDKSYGNGGSSTMNPQRSESLVDDEQQGLDMGPELFELDDEDGPKKKRKRNRQAMSCSECKRRKIKCDRRIPCESCIRRGENDKCHWEDPKKEPPPQPFALATDFHRLQRRVAGLEALLTKYPPHAGVSKVSTSSDADPESRPAPSLHPRDGSHAGHKFSPPPQELSEGPVDDMDTEDAALVLEEIGVGVNNLPRATDDENQPVPFMAGRVPMSFINRRGFNAAPDTISTERTKYGTSIIRERSSWRSTANPMLVQLRETRQKNLRDEVWSVLPKRRATADILIEIYWNRAAWSWPSLNEAVFRCEYEYLWTELLNHSRTDDVDPGFLAVYSMVLCIGSFIYNPKRDPELDIGLPHQHMSCLSDIYAEAGLRALEAAEWQRRPRVRSILALGLYAPFLYFNGETFRTSSECQTWTAAALRLAQLMQFHRLGEPNFFPADDPALPPGKNTLKREIAKRAYVGLRFMDTMTAITFPIGLPVAPSDDCEALFNAHDDELPYDRIEIIDRPLEVPTNVMWEKIKQWMIPLQEKMLTLKLARNPSYNDVKKLDEEWMEILNRLPDWLRISYEPPEDEEPRRAWLRYLVSQVVANRLLRLHRPWFRRGYSDPEYYASTSCCVTAARIVLTSQLRLMDAPTERYAFFHVHLLSACVVIFIDIFASEDRPEQELEEKLKDLRESLILFDKSASSTSPFVQLVAAQAKKVVIGLLEKEEERRRSPVMAKESFAKVISSVVASLSPLVQSPSLEVKPDSPTHKPSRSPQASVDSVNGATSKRYPSEPGSAEENGIRILQSLGLDAAPAVQSQPSDVSAADLALLLGLGGGVRGDLLPQSTYSLTSQPTASSSSHASSSAHSAFPNTAAFWNDASFDIGWSGLTQERFSGHW